MAAVLICDAVRLSAPRRRPAKHSCKGTGDRRLNADGCSQTGRPVADGAALQDASEDQRSCAEGIVRMRVFRQWDPFRFKLQRRLPLAVRPGRQIELYIDGLSGQTVVAKRFPREHVEERVRAMCDAGHGGLETAWPEVAFTQRLGCKQDSRGHGLCSCLGAFRDEQGDALLVTEYVPGGDLLEFALRLGPPGPEREQQAVPVILALLRSVLRLHARGIAHCDVSLENALLRPGPQGEVVLIDFETAVSRGHGLQTGVRGKPSYQAPEMYSHQQWDAFAADLFSCGVAAYCLAVGSFPWDRTAPGKCSRFAFFAENSFPTFLQNRRISIGNGRKSSVAECLSPRLSKLLEVLLSLRPEIRQLAYAFL